MQAKNVQNGGLESAFDIVFGTAFRISRFGFIGVGKVAFQEDKIVVVGPKRIDFFYKFLVTTLFVFSTFGFVYQIFFIVTMFVFPLLVFCFLFVLGVVERIVARFLPRIEIVIDYAKATIKTEKSGRTVLLFKKDGLPEDKNPIVFRIKKSEDIQKVQELMQQKGVVEI